MSLLRRLARHTEPAPGAVDRLRAHFAPPSAAPALQAMRDPDPAIVDRLRRRVRPRPRRAASRLVTALGLVALGSLLPSRWSPPPPLVGATPPAVPTEPPSPTALAPETAAPPLERPAIRPIPPPTRAAVKRAIAHAVDVPASLAASPVPVPPLPLVPAPDPFTSLLVSSDAEVVREGQEARVRWEVGTLEARLDGGGDAFLVVETREGTARLGDGQMETTRDRLGTEVVAVRGTVEVQCGSSDPRVLLAPAATLCLPTRAAGWLGRASALRERGEGSAVVLPAIDSGLNAATDLHTQGELVALAVEVLLAEGNRAAARARAADYPAEGPRAAEMGRLR